MKAKKRFLSTIARRLDTLGAITRGRRQTGGQVCSGPRTIWRASTGEDATGMKLMDANGMKDEMPPITTFLNRLLALTDQQHGAWIGEAIQDFVHRHWAIALTLGDGEQAGHRAGVGMGVDRAPIGDDEALGPERLQPDVVGSRCGGAFDAGCEQLLEGREQRVLQVDCRQAELAEVPAYTDSTIHIVAGLLLPIWKRLPNESTRVYRLQTDAGERIIGHKVSPAWVATALATNTPALTAASAFAALMEGRIVLDLGEGLQLRCVRVMGANRIELSGFTVTMRDRLKAYGLFHEIISCKLRMFVPTDAGGVEVLAKVLDRYPVERIGEREAA